jgi:hypothetical protein
MCFFTYHESIELAETMTFMTLESGYETRAALRSANEPMTLGN